MKLIGEIVLEGYADFHKGQVELYPHRKQIVEELHQFAEKWLKYVSEYKQGVGFDIRYYLEVQNVPDPVLPPKLYQRILGWLWKNLSHELGISHRSQYKLPKSWLKIKLFLTYYGCAEVLNEVRIFEKEIDADDENMTKESAVLTEEIKNWKFNNSSNNYWHTDGMLLKIRDGNRIRYRIIRTVFYQSKN